MNLKALIATLGVIAGINFGILAQGLSFEWATQAGRQFNDMGKSIITDSQNNVIIAGQFKDTVDFDPGAGVSTIGSVGYDDYFIQKLDTDGNLLWVKGIGGELAAVSEKSITTDNLDNIYVVGWYNGTVDFDPDPVNTYWMTSATNTANVFIQKLDASGNFVWAINFGMTSTAAAYSVSTDELNNIYVTGQFKGNIDFDPGPGTATLFTTTNSSDIFLLKFNTSGSLQWAHQFGSSWGIDYGYSVSNDRDNNVYITGFFEGFADFDPGAGVTTLTSEGAKDIFVAKYSPAGNLVWAHQLGSNTDDYGVSITNDTSANVLITGEYSGLADFDPGPTDASMSPVGASFNSYIVKLDSAGLFLWSNTLETSYFYADRKIVTDNDNNVFISGHFNGTIDIDPGPDSDSVTSVGATDLFIQKLNPSGNLVWAKSIGGSGSDRANGITTDQTNAIYITGSFLNTVDFDPGGQSFTLSSNGGNDEFVLKFNQCQNSEDSISVLICNDTTYYSPSGKLWTTAGIYTDTITNHSGCDSIIIVDLSFLLIDNSLALAGTTISANQNGALYQWVDCNDGNAPISGETGQSFSPQANGLYAVEITMDSCSILSTCVAIVNVGLDNHSTNPVPKLFPNPASNLLTLKDVPTGSTVTIFDMAGRKVLTHSSPTLQNEITFSVSNLLKGVYLVSVQYDSNQYLIKLIKD